MKKFAMIVVAVLVAIVALAATKPDTFTVKRSVSIKAPPEKVAAMITDFHQWKSWSPWENLDPAMKRTFTGAQSGKGAVYEWEGNKEVGKGRMEITDASAPARTVIKLDFLQPMEAHSITEFTLAPQGGETLVTWNMSGPMLFISKIMSVFTSMDAMIGKDFEKGLSNMKTVAEKS
jgi:uncharacterized protein YndB with AHSA1/START domain